MKTKRQGVATIFALPLLIAAATTVGLVSALTGDGWRDWLSWITLAVPVVATWWAMKRRRG